MSIEKLEVFASQADKNTDGITLKYGFPSAEKPARQWFNWLFYTQTSKINEVADLANSNFTRVKDIDLKYEQLKRDTTKQLQDTASSLQDVRDYADQLMQTAVGGKLAYKTYAEMIADKSNIATNSSIDIIADTDDKNGTYLYDGTDFVKSKYNLEKLIRAKVQNTFGTYAQMVASNLGDGAYALVADDADDKNGIYIKEGGVWVKSKYDLHGDFISLRDSLNALIYTEKEDSKDIIRIEDSNNVPVYRCTKDGKHLFFGMPEDLHTNLKKLDFFDENYTKNILEVQDLYGVKSLTLDDQGRLHTYADGNISKKLSSVINDVEVLKELGGVSDTSKKVNTDIEASAEFADRVMIDLIQPYKEIGDLLTVAEIKEANVFSHEVRYVRIPAMNRIGASEYIIFYEAREELGDFSLISVGSAVVNINKEDFSVSTTKIRNLHESYVDSTGKLRSFLNACSVLLDDGRLLCLYVRRYSTTEHELYLRYSNDKGDSWSDFIDISSIYRSLNWNLVCPCSQGIIKRHGANKGRIIFPVWTTGVGYSRPNYRAGFIYSDDNGATWELGDFVNEPEASECQIAENRNGDLLLTMRLEHHNPPRKVFVLPNGEHEYKEIVQSKSLTSDAVMGGLIQGENRWDNTTPKVMLSVCKTANRRGLYVHTSYDFGKSWITYEFSELATTNVAYSCIDNIDAHHKFVMWENITGNKLQYSVISMKNLLEGI